MPYFPTSPFVARIPNPPTVNANSSAWIANAQQLGAFGIGDLYAYTSRAPNTTEIAFPVYLNHMGSNTPVRIHCLDNYGGTAHPCNVEGETVYVDSRELPQNGGNPSGSHLDAHWALIDPAAGYEYTTWQTQWPPQNGVLTVGYGGRCALQGDGFTNPSYNGPSWNTGCSADASGTPLSMGTLRVKDILWAAQNGGALPQALNVTLGCSGVTNQLPAPFIGGGDGKCSGAAPEGSHLYLAMHDAAVNALGAPPILAAILRTLDEDHFGAFVTDSSSGASPVISLNVESDETYAAFGQPGPWISQFLPEAQKEGLPTYNVPSENRVGIKLPLPSAINWSNLRFL